MTLPWARSTEYVTVSRVLQDLLRTGAERFGTGSRPRARSGPPNSRDKRSCSRSKVMSRYDSPAVGPSRGIRMPDTSGWPQVIHVGPSSTCAVAAWRRSSQWMHDPGDLERRAKRLMLAQICYAGERVIRSLDAEDAALPCDVSLATTVGSAEGMLIGPTETRWSFRRGRPRAAGPAVLKIVDRDHEGRSVCIGDGAPTLRGWSENWDEITDWSTVLTDAETVALLLNPRLDREILAQSRSWTLTFPRARTESFDGSLTSHVCVDGGRA
jgi:hypothetical protein